MKIIVHVTLYGEFYSMHRVTMNNVTTLSKPLMGTEACAPALNDPTLHVETSAYFLFSFLREVLHSVAFRKNLLVNSCAKLNYPACKKIYLNLDLKPPDQEIIDYGWNERMLSFIWMRVEIDNAFSWLSTLGGAFSALGDYFEHCAEMAGKISIQQLQLSMMLGDESLAARSRLYSSLALAQKGKLKFARKVVRSVADFARSTKDKRLIRMCQGVWAKLRYLRGLKNAVQLKDKGDVQVHRKEVNAQRDPS